MINNDMDQFILSAENVMDFKLPRWDDLPHFDLYLDQVINLIDDYLYLFNFENEPNILTKSMVHNYVKLGLIPKPEKKKYNRKHLAYLIAITILKRVMTISEIKAGILYQAKISGTNDAYELFIDEQEYALHAAASHFTNQKVEQRPIHEEDETSLIRNVTQSLASQIIAKNLVQMIIKKENSEENETNE